MVECSRRCGRHIGRFTDDMLCFHCEKLVGQQGHVSNESHKSQPLPPVIQNLVERIESLEYSNDMMKKALGEKLEYKGQNELLTINEKYLQSKVDILMKENKILEERLDSMKERFKKSEKDELDETLKTIDQLDQELSKISTADSADQGVKQVLNETLTKLEQLNSTERIEASVTPTIKPVKETNPSSSSSAGASSKIKIPTPEEEDEMKASALQASKPKSNELVDRLSRPTSSSSSRAEEVKKRRGKKWV